MRKSKKLIDMFIVLIFALMQILPSGYIWAGDSHIEKAMGRVNQDMMASFAPRYVQQASLEKNQSLTTDDINRKKALEEPLENLKKPINKPKTESVTLRKPQELNSVSNEAKTESVTYSITVGGDTGGGTGGGTTTPPKGGDDGNSGSDTQIGIRRPDGTILLPGSPHEETGTDNQGRGYIKKFDKYGRIISDHLEGRGTITYLYDDTLNKVTMTADFNPSGNNLPDGYTTGGDNGIGWVLSGGKIVAGNVSLGGMSWLQTQIDLTNFTGTGNITFDWAVQHPEAQEIKIYIYDSTNSLIAFEGIGLAWNGMPSMSFDLPGGQIYTVKWVYTNSASAGALLATGSIDNVKITRSVTETFESSQNIFRPSPYWEVYDVSEEDPMPSQTNYVYRRTSSNAEEHRSEIDGIQFKGGILSMKYKTGVNGFAYVDLLDSNENGYRFEIGTGVFGSFAAIYSVTNGINDILNFGVMPQDYDPTAWNILTIDTESIYAGFNIYYMNSGVPDFWMALPANVFNDLISTPRNISIVSTSFFSYPPVQFDDVSLSETREELFPAPVAETPFTPTAGDWSVVEDGAGNYVYTQNDNQSPDVGFNWRATMNDVQAGNGSVVEYRFKMRPANNYSMRAGLIFSLNNNEGYLAQVTSHFDITAIQLWRINTLNGNTTFITSDVLLSEVGDGNYHGFRVELRDGTAYIFVDDQLSLQVQGLDLSVGGLGLAAGGDETGSTPLVYFDDIKVTNPSGYALVTVPRQEVPTYEPPRPIPITPTIPLIDDTATATTTPQEPPIAGQKGIIHDRSRFIVPEEYNQTFRRNKRSLELKITDEAFNYDRRKYHDYEKELKETLSQWTPLRALTKTVKIEESLQSFIMMLVNKPNKTKAEDQMLEVIGMVMAESAYIPGDVMEEFEQVIQRVRVAQKMEGVLNEGDLKRITDAMTDLSQRQKELYKEYLSRTENTYEQLAQLLGIDIDIEEVPDEYITIANMSIQAKRKILVDLRLLDLELAGDKGGLTDSQRKALKINESSLRKVREEYANKMAIAITKFINTIKEALRNISGSGAVMNESDINTNSLKTLFLLDKGIV